MYDGPMYDGPMYGGPVSSWPYKVSGNSQPAAHFIGGRRQRQCTTLRPIADENLARYNS